MNTNQGYLVVLKTAETHSLIKNKRYNGVYRIPSYRLKNQNPIEAEVEAMNRYILGNVRNELGFIESYKAASELYAQFAKSPRKFEIIWCRVSGDGLGETDETPFEGDWKFLGFDVASVGGDYWSIVADFPDDQRVNGDFAKLNDSGLFSSAHDAAEYLKKYRLFKLPDYDCPFKIVEVRKTL